MMRNTIEAHKGQRLYLFTTFGAVYAAMVIEVVDDVIHLRGVDGKNTFVNLQDVSGLRTYDGSEVR